MMTVAEMVQHIQSQSSEERGKALRDVFKEMPSTGQITWDAVSEEEELADALDLEWGPDVEFMKELESLES